MLWDPQLHTRHGFRSRRPTLVAGNSGDLLGAKGKLEREAGGQLQENGIDQRVCPKNNATFLTLSPLCVYIV